MLNKINLLDFGNRDVMANFYCLYGEVTDEESKNITEWILSNNFAPEAEKPECLNLLVNSYGGSLTAAWAIIDMMRGSHIPVRVIGLGEIASAGLLILMSGVKGHRTISENSSIMSHQFSAGNGGKYHDLVSMQTEYSNTQKRLMKHIKKCTGLTDSEINDKLMPPSDVWLTAQEAVALGLADRVSSLK